MKSTVNQNDPLRIPSVRFPTGGRIGMTLCPGRCDDLSNNGPFRRDLSADLDAVAEWKPDLILTLMENHEFAKLGVPDFPAVVGKRFPGWRHLPIPDAGVPDRAFEDAWGTVGDEARTILMNGGKVLIHCRAGLGRTGMIAARLLVELGSDPDEAIAMVRKVRPNAIETRAQEEYVRAQSRMEADPIKDRLAGAMLGAAIGDALGSAFEFMSSANIKAVLGSSVVRDYFGGQAGSLMPGRAPGIPTDDTAMTLALVDALTADEPPTPLSIQKAFGESLSRGRGSYADMFWKGAPGGACTAMLRAYDAGAKPFAGINPEAGGNGAAMRAHPCGVFTDRAYVAQLAAEQARISHPHPGAVAAAQVVALVVHEGIYTGQLTESLPAEITDRHMIAAWDAAHANLVRGDELPKHLRDADMAGWTTVATAHAIAVLYSDDIETGIGIAAGSGQDTDTVATIVGAMLGAVHGRRALPTRWIQGLKYLEMLEAAVGMLYEKIILLEQARGTA
jgi:ADP-ribosyl-[dinitrogen reductase] hydrolase